MAISRDKLIIGGVVVLGALSALVYSQAKKDEALGSAAAKSADLPDVKGTDDVDKLVITNADKGTVTLEKQGDGFAITKVHLTLKAKIPGCDQTKFAELAAKAKAGCPVSKLLKAEITLDASLI